MGEKFARWFYEWLETKHGRFSRILYNSTVREDLQTLEPAGNIPRRQKEYVIKKLSMCIIIVVIGILLSTALWIKDSLSAKVVDNSINRNSYGDGMKKVSLVANDGKSTYDIPVTVEEKQFTQEELLELSEEIIPVLEKNIIGENAGFDEIAYDVRLIKSVDGYPFDVEWRVDEEYMDCEGRLVRDKIDSPKLVELTAVLSCEGFEIEHNMTLNIHSKALQPDKAEQIAKVLQNVEQESRQQRNVTLPSEIEDQHIQWSYKRNYTGLLFLMAAPVLAILVYYSRDRDLHMQVVSREEQMRMDYPEIVSSLAMLIGAGMTVPNAWNKIAKDYKNRKEQEKESSSKRYAYEEMLLAVYEMESGVAQTKAYEHFGRRCRIPDYNKLSTMLSQSIRKGVANLPSLLKEEAAQAFEERKHMARKQGEKAGTKLLIPMMMLLGITMVVIMIPAFRTYL